MERSLWVRLVLLVAMVLGSVWLVLPSFLEERTIEVDVASTQQEKNTEAWFVTPGAVPEEATAEAIDARLRAAGVGIERVVTEDDRIVVHLQPGTFKDDVEKAVLGPAAPTPQVDLVGPSAVGLDPSTLPASGPERDAAIARALAGATLAAGTTPIAAGVPVHEAGGDVIVAANAPADAATPLVATQGGAIVGWVDPASGETPLHLVGPDEAATRARVLTPVEVAPLPQPVERWKPPVAEAPKEQQPEQAKAWWQAYLPDVKVALGIDLQGGIDLTLQVDQDAAVAASLLRDRRILADEGAKEGKAIEAVRDRSRDALRVAITEDDAALREWVASKLGSTYAYAGVEEAEGKRWQVWEMSETAANQIREQAVDQNLETLRKRVDATGVKEPSIVKMSGGRINIQLPGVKDAQAATAAIGTQATLEFRMVDVDADRGMLSRHVTEAEQALPPDQFEDVEILNDWLRERDYLPPDRVVMFMYDTDPATGKSVRGAPMLVFDDIELTGADIDNALVSWNDQNIPYVHLQMKARGAARFCEITTNNVGKPFAIILDEQIRSAPRINEAICGGSAQITMGNAVNAVDEANMLALVLRTGALTAPVDVGQVQLIGATLGADAIRSGTLAGIIGLAIIFAFMAFRYKVAGLVADFALFMNLMFVIACLALFGATLTLPGIAGLALTTATAVDSNILIYERIREELKLGVNAKKAVEAGFDKALSAILDSNITNAIAGVVLYSYGSGPIKGFAVTLLVGIGTMLIAALVVTRWLLALLTRRADARLSI
jgi:protein-export membrane protein SecD